MDFLILATGLSKSAACVKFIELAGGGRCDARITPQRTAPAPQARQKPTLPAMDGGDDEELRQLAALRNLDINALRLARSLNVLAFANLHGHRAWIVTDGEGFNAQARRLDGGKWEHIEGAKSYTLPQCWAAWPLGLAIAPNYRAFMLCEGGPDFLAAFHFILKHDAAADVCPLALLGATQRIPDDALQILAEKKVRIFQHVDPAGKLGAERWTAQLRSVGADVELFDFTGLRKADGSPVKDLNDCTQIHPGDAAELEGILP